MPTMPPTFRSRFQCTKAERDKASDARRGSASSRGYDGAWAKASRGHLRSDPFCRYCDLIGDTTPATLVDHLYPHKGDRWLFWLRQFWVSSCKDCHDAFKQRIERRGLAAIDLLAQQLNLPTLAEARRAAGGGGG